MHKKLTLVIYLFFTGALPLLANTPDVDWFRSATGTGTAIARDGNDNVYSTRSEGTIFLAKRDKFGNFLWERNFTTGILFNYEFPVKVHADSRGDVVVVGYRHTHSIENGNRANALIILKYNAAGTLLWQQVIEGYYSAFYQERYHNKVTSVLDGSDNIYVASGGYVSGGALGFNTIKINPAGSVAWKQVQAFGNSPYYLVDNIRSKGKLLGVGGYGQLQNNALLWVLDTSGNSLGSKSNPGYSGRDIVFDNAGNIYLMTILTNGAGSNTLGDIGVYKFRPNGTQAWVHAYDFNGSEGGVEMLLGADNNIAICAWGNQAPNISYYSDWLTLKIDLDGNLLWGKRYDRHSNNDEFPTDMELDNAGNIFITGAGGPFPGGSNLGKTQWITLKYLSNGTLDWFQPVDTLSEYIGGNALTLAADKSLFVIANVNAAIIHIMDFTGQGSCSVPAGLSVSHVYADSATIQWNAVPGANLYHVSYKTATSPTWIKLSANQTSYTLKPLFAGTTYDYRVEAVCASGLSGYSTPQQFTTTGAGYCISRGSSSAKEWIDLVYVNDMLNSTGNDGGYRDYTYRTANLVAGNTYELTLSAEFNAGSYNEAWSVWIDYNRDGDFSDANELLFRYKSSQIGWESHNFTVPPGAAGVTRMRVAMANKNYSNPCDTFARGDVEDYSVNIIPSTSVAIASAISKEAVSSKVTVRLSPNPANDFIIVDATGFTGKTALQIFDATGRLVINRQEKNMVRTQLNISHLSKGLYILCITDEKGDKHTMKWIKE